jgi:hypothetical protein
MPVSSLFSCCRFRPSCLVLAVTTVWPWCILPCYERHFHFFLLSAVTYVHSTYVAKPRRATPTVLYFTTTHSLLFSESILYSLFSNSSSFFCFSTRPTLCPLLSLLFLDSYNNSFLTPKPSSPPGASQLCCCFRSLPCFLPPITSTCHAFMATDAWPLSSKPLLSPCRIDSRFTVQSVCLSQPASVGTAISKASLAPSSTTTLKGKPHHLAITSNQPMNREIC